MTFVKFQLMFFFDFCSFLVIVLVICGLLVLLDSELRWFARMSPGGSVRWWLSFGALLFLLEFL